MICGRIRSWPKPFVEPVAFLLGSCVLLTIAGCADGPSAGDACEQSSDCGRELSCVEGVCAPTFELPPGEGEGSAGPVRVFAVGWKVDLTELESFGSFDAAVRTRVDAEVTPNLAADRPNLLVFPENMGLLAALVGERGTAARAASDTKGAFLALSEAYADAIAHYRGRTTELLPLGRAILLGVTDTLWRTLEGTFAAMARELGAYVAVTYDLADADRTSDPALIPALVDPSVTSPDGAWVAQGNEVHNQTVLFGPDGERIVSWRKEYLVPTEESLLTLVHGDPGGLEAAPTPFGRTASVISKDAWMPDVLDRLASAGAHLMMQPEAFDKWGVPHGDDGAWAPDVVKESGWAHVMRYPEFRTNVLSCMSGNLFDEVFDCQSAILVDAHLDGSGAFIGQDPDVGFARVAPWVVPDDGTGTLEERRAELIAVGETLLPGSGDPAENAYVASTVWMDVDLDAPWPGAVATGTVVRGAGEGVARRPAAAALDDGSSFVLWEDTRDGPSRPFGARSVDGAASFGDPRLVAAVAEGFRSPALAVDGEILHAVWRQRSADGGDVWYARSEDGGRSFPQPVALAGGPEDGAAQHAPAIAVDAETGGVHVVWIDDGTGAMRVHYAHSDDRGRTFDEPTPVEDTPTGAPVSEHNRWDPDVAARGGAVAVTWASFRGGAWSIEGVTGVEGEGFGSPFRWDDADVPFETIHSDPAVVALDDGGWMLAWTDLRVRRPDYDVRARRLPADGDPAGAAPSILLPRGDTGGRPQWAPSVAARGDTVVAVWQDFRADRNDTWMARSIDGGRTFSAEQPVSSSNGPEHFSPVVTLDPDGAIVMVDECTHGGARRICATAP